MLKCCHILNKFSQGQLKYTSAVPLLLPTYLLGSVMIDIAMCDVINKRPPKCRQILTISSKVDDSSCCLRDLRKKDIVQMVI